MTSGRDVEAQARAVQSGERRALAKTITLVESARRDHQEQAQRLLESLLPHTGQARRVGISGVPGVGKSTFIEALGLFLVEQGHRVAVLAVDPSSQISGGSILGDKTRMPRLSASEEAFIRPSPAGGSLGGVARRTREAMLVCEAAGFDVVLVETVGVGQSEHAVASMVDTFLLLALAGAGDELQGIKRGILELVDVVCVNKADGDNLERARRAAVELKSALRLLRGSSSWAPPVLTASALAGKGIAEVWQAVEDHCAHLVSDGTFERKRASQRSAWLSSLVRDGLEAEFFARSDVLALKAEVEASVERLEITPTEGARRLLSLVSAERYD
jgi:LAO/AO transport system kinase